MILLFIFSIFLSSFSLCNNRFSDDIVLLLDPMNLSTYVLDKYHPNLNKNINYYSISIDGSTNMPLNHLLPENLYFDYNDISGSISQLFYEQNKNDKYFNTKVAAANSIGSSTKSIFQLESKSLVENINQNIFMNINKKTDNLNLNFSYLYHYDREPDQYNLHSSINEFKKENESFITGYNISYKKNNISFESSLSIQNSFHKRSELYEMDFQYLSYIKRSIFNNNQINLDLGSLSVYFGNINQDIILKDDLSNTNFYKKHNNTPSLGMNINEEKFNMKIYGSEISGEYKPSFEIVYFLNNSYLKFSSENYFYGLLVDNDELYGEYSFNDYLRNNFTISYDFNNYDLNINLGEIDSDEISYNYFLFSGQIDYSFFDFEYDYFKYLNKSENLGIDDYLKISLGIYPYRNKYDFDFFAKINFNHYTFDREIDILSMNLFSSNIEYYQTQLYSFEFGFDFDSFIISYKSKNLLSNDVIFPGGISPFKRFDYINIIWVFKD